MHQRRRFMVLSAAAVATGFPDFAQGRALDRPARLMVGFPAGSSPDFVARLLAEHLREYAPAIIVDNKPGAGGRLPLEALKAAERDGSVMVLTPGDQVAIFFLTSTPGWVTTASATSRRSQRCAPCSFSWPSALWCPPRSRR